LILILQKRETLALARLLVSDEIDMRGVPELRENGNDITFGDVKRQPADVDVGCVAVVGVPGGGGRDGIFKFEFIEGLSLAD
jgi:hypothetical protein